MLPQAFRSPLPPTINQVVITFMETSLIVVIGFFEVTASANAAFSSGGWNATYVEVYTFVALIYFIFTFSLPGMAHTWRNHSASRRAKENRAYEHYPQHCHRHCQPQQISMVNIRFFLTSPRR